jgi:hypothetical protein
MPYMDKITLTCLKVMTDRDKDIIKDQIRILAATFITKIVMAAGEEYVQKLKEFEMQMSPFEKELVAKYMAKVTQN